MAYLYEDYDIARSNGWDIFSDVPMCIIKNLNPNFELRPYQEHAFENFITYFEDPGKRSKPTQVLFHMATGSGKTLIMAGLMLYLYEQGYRDFLFFVNLSNIVKKTKENFLSVSTAKYLFEEDIVIGNDKIAVREVDNFQYSDSNSINICFTTTQGLHWDMLNPKENSVTYEDFIGRKVVLISDESHHINASTKKLNKEEEAADTSWELTVRRIFESNPDNVLLEFTATCDLKNREVQEKYKNKIIYDYPLKKFRDDRYSKEIKTLRSDLSVIDKMLQACMLSQYRLKVFQDNLQSVKPVIMFKAKRSTSDTKTGEKTADEWMELFVRTINSISGTTLANIAATSTSEAMNSAYRYFTGKGITFDMLAQELRDGFSEENCISANDGKQAEKNQLALNSLEDKNNPYRAVFAVNKLDEGWDVLNLFDIVRLYETRQSGGKQISKTTISEAQLIGRGARYYPFQLSMEQEKYRRKYDENIDDPLRICEELYYHCQNDSRYIAELHDALREIGFDLDKAVTRKYTLKSTFKGDYLYTHGFVFSNSRQKIDRTDMDGFSQSVIDRPFNVRLATGQGGEDVILDSAGVKDSNVELHTTPTTIGNIARINYAIVHKAIRRHSVFRYNTLRSYFPNLNSIRDFIFGDKYLNNIKVNITSKHKNLPPSVLYDACVYVLAGIATEVKNINEVYSASAKFDAQYIRDVFDDKSVIYTDPSGGGRGISQSDATVHADYRLDLSKEDWYAYNDNYGTSEEKRFVAYFKMYATQLQSKYDKVYLVRNERHLPIYSFASGERFEPDYLLFLHSSKTDGYEQYQIFIEPKGTHLIPKESWKESFLLELEAKAVPVKRIADDNEYRIWGFHFFNHEARVSEFDDDFARILPRDGDV